MFLTIFSSAVAKLGKLTSRGSGIMHGDYWWGANSDSTRFGRRQR